MLLPFSTCSYYVDAEGERIIVEVDEPLPAGVREVHDQNVPAESLVPFDPERAPYLLAFLWPLLGSLYARLGRRPRLKRSLWCLEPLLICASAWVFVMLALFGKTAFGFFMAAAALGLYGVAWLLELVLLLRGRSVVRSGA
jgi:hypothetical protein